ncbi:MAG: ribbon-helix-helix domain-containing protein [Rhodospirillaceae bacterium]|nr:ribbon-helix-helix domain-containing protein [Rhodospirillaceae bacterium]
MAGAAGGAGVRKRSVRIAGHRTSLSLEDAFWDVLKEIAAARGVSLARLIAEIDAARAAEGAPANLSSAARLHVLRWLRRSAPSQP